MIIVTGPGRCGSSTVARILHHQFGVSMGGSFREPDAENPCGFYEDLDFKGVNEKYLRGELAYRDWRNRVRSLIRERREPWGLKDPRLCYLLTYYRIYLPYRPTIIRCRRDVETMVASWSRCYGWPEIDIQREIVQRERALDSAIAGLAVTEIWFDRERSDEELYIEIGPCANQDRVRQAG